ncbi:hypothetical protein A6R71_02635 [Xanthomonas translucens pv. arrhenatheri]|nr:hypothetical protein [Xanthomonas translucens]OAX63813.1 hypothetical protein A6R71_02635 [Xanthomonas translucens pv. arrhenatheri]UKE77228.1 hypothetical protein KM317_17685 [Xanthomonas translucens pv. arrhenatheri]
MKMPLFHQAHAASDVRLQFIDWAKRHGHSPASGAASFVDQQADLDAAARHLRLNPGEDVRQELRRYLASLGEQQDVAVQFPPIYACRNPQGQGFRYSLTLVLAESGVEWKARVWSGLEYLGLIVGRGAGPRANYTRLARMAVEQELTSDTSRFTLG